ncbi:MAG: sugar phosphate isomerase/epimerase [Kiritimatiellae bacterium]|nr:sugar phosphate isomerase/epimerase [Kiritimatiellia bacterium]
MGSLKISCALWSLSTGPTREKLDEALTTAAAVGVQAVQPWCVDVEKWKTVCMLDPDRCTGAKRKEMAAHIRGFGLEISGFCAQLAGPTTLGGFGEADGLDARIRKTQDALRLAAEMGAPIVTTHIGPIPEDRNSEVYKRFLDSVGAVTKAGEACGGLFALETGQETAHVLRQFIEDVGSPALKVNYDPANMLKHGTVEGVEILKDHIVHTHAKDRHPESGTQTVGRGAVPWDAYIAALKGIGYDGWYAIEDESKTDKPASIRAGREFLERY